MNYATFEPPAQYTSNMYDRPSHQVQVSCRSFVYLLRAHLIDTWLAASPKDLAEQYPYQGNDNTGHYCPPPEAAQHTSDPSVIPALPLLEHYAPLPPVCV